MEYYELIPEVLASLLTVQNLALLILGVFIGASFGAIPGLSGILAVGLLLPFTFFMPIVPSLALLLGTYKGAMFGGSVSAISFGVPGDSPAAATVLDGWPLSRKGLPHKALDTALISSIIGNFFADIVVLLTLVPISMLALKFGPRELAALMIVALGSLVLLLGGSVKKGLLGIMIGVFIATVGFDPVTSIPRLTFGTSTLMDGIPLVPFVVGLFAFSELLLQYGLGVRRGKEAGDTSVSDMIRKRAPNDRWSFREQLSCWREGLIGCSIGAFLGSLPGPGATMSAFSSYGIASRLKRNRGKMGTGVIEGVVAAESANSSTVGPTLIPLLTFGIPGSGIAALFAGAFLLQGLTPGPGLFTDHLDLIVAVMLLMVAGTFINLGVGKAIIIPVFSRLALIEPRMLVAWLTPIMAVGIYAVNLRHFDVLVMFAAGLLGLLLRRVRIPLAPVAVAMMVAPLFEVHFRRALILGKGSVTYWFASPISLVLYLVAILLVVYAWRTK